MLYNPYFTQMLNPGYLDIIGCPYLNYAKNPEVALIESNDSRITVPEQNVSNFVDSLKYDWESLPKETQDEYYSALTKFMEHKNIKENLENTPLITNEVIIVYLLTMLGLIIYYFNFKNMGSIYLAVYLIIVLIGSALYYFSQI